MNKESFIKLIEGYQKWDNRIEEVGKVFNTFIWEADWIQYTSELFDTYLNEVFTEEALNTINWWMFEKAGRSDMKMWEDGKEIPTETIEDLWNIVKTEMK